MKPISSTIIGHPEYYMNGPGTPIAVSGPHVEFFNCAFGISIGGNIFKYGYCISIRMVEV